MLSLGKSIGRLVGLAIVTVFAIAVMFAGDSVPWATSEKDAEQAERQSERQTKQAAPKAMYKTPVSVVKVVAEPIEVLLSCSGMIRPFERYRLGFEVAGRIESLGTDEEDKPLDDGDHVRKGQVLAVLDQRVMLAKQKEAAARLEQSEADLNRLKRLRVRAASIVTDAEYQKAIADVAVAAAVADIAEENLKDATLVSPADAVISKRRINAGEAVSAHEIAFELVEIDRVLLVVGIPESKVHQLERRRRVLESRRNEMIHAQQLGQAAPYTAAELAFTVHVRLMGTNRFGTPWQLHQGKVYHIAETADQMTGQFEIEILLSNRKTASDVEQQGVLKPGVIAAAQIVVDEFRGFRLPLTSAVFRDGKAFLYSVDQSDADVRFLFWKAGDGKVHRTRSFELAQYIEQGTELLIPEPSLPPQNRVTVVRGQHRLYEGATVQIVSASDSALGGDVAGVVRNAKGAPAVTIGTRPSS